MGPILSLPFLVSNYMQQLIVFFFILASTVAMPNSQVFVFTDATPKDPNKINYITSLITEKKLRVQFLVTGTCTRRKRSTGNLLNLLQSLYLFNDLSTLFKSDLVYRFQSHFVHAYI